MAVISEDIGNVNNLLGELKNGDNGLRQLETILEYRDNHLKFMAVSRRKSDRKFYNKGVYIINYTCKECGSEFKIKMPVRLFHLISKEHLIAIKKLNRPANELEIYNLLKVSKSSIPILDTFRSGKVLCPACVSKNKNKMG